MAYAASHRVPQPPQSSPEIWEEGKDESYLREVPDAWMTDGWTGEYVAGAISVLSLTALIVVLAALDGKPAFNWHNVTINTLVALLSTVSRASLMVTLSESISQAKWVLFARSKRPLYDFELVDRASRSSLGRLNVLRRVPNGLVSIGVVAALLSLAFDPFAQQLVQRRASVRFVHDNSTQLPVANRYAQGTIYGSRPESDKSFCDSSHVAVDDTPLTTEADFGMQSAALYGLGGASSAAITQQLTWTCSTGNCTWAPVSSLAICSRCTDLRNQLISYPTEQASQALDHTAGAEEMLQSTAIALPNGVYMLNINGTKFAGMESLMITYGSSHPPDTMTFKDVDTLIYAVTMLRVQPDPTSNATAWPHLPMDAAECGLYYCVNTYSSNVTNGVLSETDRPTNSTRNRDSWQPTTFDLKLTDAEIESIEFDPCASSVARTDLMIGNGFNVSWQAVNSINVYVGSFFSVTLHDVVQPDSNGKNQTQRYNGYYVAPNEEPPQWGPASMQPLRQSQDWDATFSRIAQSMTNSIRSKASNSSRGEVGTPQILVSVQWPWISLPILVVLASLAQLAISVEATRRSNAPIWKSSSLATMSCAHDVSDLLRRSRYVRQMEGLAMGEKVDLFQARSDRELGPVPAQAGDDAGDGVIVRKAGYTQVADLSGFPFLDDQAGQARRQTSSAIATGHEAEDVTSQWHNNRGSGTRW